MMATMLLNHDDTAFGLNNRRTTSSTGFCTVTSERLRKV